MREQNVGCGCLLKSAFYRRAIDVFPARSDSAIRPIMNRFFRSSSRSIGSGRPSNRSSIRAVRPPSHHSGCRSCTENAALARIIGSFLRPINLSAVRINSDADTPFGLGRYQDARRLCFVSTRVSMFDHPGSRASPHSFAVAPISLPLLFSRWSLLRRECLAFANDGYAILAIEIDALIEPSFLLGTPMLVQ